MRLSNGWCAGDRHALREGGTEVTVTKEQLHEAVLAHQDDLLKLCQQLIQIKNQSPIDDQEPAIKFVRDYLAEHGIESERIVLRERLCRRR